jgi:hypothetical protein
MVTVSKKWIRENVVKLSSRDGRITLDNLDRVATPPGGFPITLSQIGKCVVEAGERTEKFRIALPGKYGYADAWPQSKPIETKL